MSVATMAPFLLFAWSLLAPLSCSASLDRSLHIFHFDKSFMPRVYASHHHWYSSIFDSIKTVGPITSQKNHRAAELIYSYDHAFHGFSAMVSKDELRDLKHSPGFLSAYTDKSATIDTTYSSEFLNLSPEVGLLPLSQYGKDIIIGVIDGGIRPESPSFNDDGMTKVPARWKGICEEGTEFNSSLCNLKIIGARSFSKGAQAERPDEPIAMNSPRDISGHGTHVASIAAGNYVKGVSHFGYAHGIARGVAPHARISVYKVLTDLGNTASDVIAGIDQAVADGVDVISISLGFNFLALHEDPLAIASFNAMEKGIFVSKSAGNSGLERKLHNGIPWVITVASGTMDRWFGGTLSLANNVSITGWSMYPAPAIIKNDPLVYDKNISSCNSTELLSQGSHGIIICDDIGAFRDQIGFIAQSNWPAAIFISDDPSIFSSNYFPHPGVVISQTDASKVISYASGNDFARATIKFQQTFVRTKQRAPVVAASSSRGPSPSYPGILKPDILAPGVLILGAYDPDSISTSIRPNIVLGTEYYLTSGTSMACPHVSGIAALLKSVHPEWSPAAIQSAIMTTANPLDNTQEFIKDSAFDYEIATPLAVGSGHVDPNRALNPGLVYDATPQDYVNLVCSMNFTTNQTLSIIRSAKYNCSNPSSDLNYPSFIALYNFDGSNNTSLVQRFQRTLTNVGNGAATYKAKVIIPNGSIIKVSPETLVFSKKYQKRSYSLTISYKSNENGNVTFGSLTWVENTSSNTVRSPIVVSPTVELL